MPKSYFYAVRIGRGGPFVYSTWEDCERATKGFPFARHKKFEQYADAQRWAFSTAPEGTPQERRRPYQRPALVPASSLLSAPRPATSLPAYGLSRGAPHPHDVICLLDSSSDIEEVPGPNTVEILSDSDRESEPYAPPQDFPDLSGAEATFAADGPLSPEQQHIFNMVVREHKSVFFTGSALGSRFCYEE
ncbi:hypothetical protein CALVIDRAFT_212230 [Calocera viscosa TUFC12733]|uniref:Ribonuclease H1 N-terminal domain-containing protein n=1 Tax=Calocera viscosa (strain TUFC12733) TaxID=1330018 RepID=A0A167RCG0_CALVF|nr:hypothetical protein CALVIDRAFT_212230 [Calocera viscosa TUFC12733]